MRSVSSTGPSPQAIAHWYHCGSCPSSYNNDFPVRTQSYKISDGCRLDGSISSAMFWIFPPTNRVVMPSTGAWHVDCNLVTVGCSRTFCPGMTLPSISWSPSTKTVSGVQSMAKGESSSDESGEADVKTLHTWKNQRIAVRLRNDEFPRC